MSSRFLRVIRISFLWPCSILSIAALAQNNAIFGFGFFATETYVNNIYLADLNGDGVPDLIETYSSLTPNGFSIQLAKGDGNFCFSRHPPLSGCRTRARYF